jgi:hypothetical protein
MEGLSGSFHSLVEDRLIPSVEAEVASQHPYVANIYRKNFLDVRL